MLLKFLNRKVREIIGIQTENVQQMKLYVENLQDDNDNLESKIHKK